MKELREFQLMLSTVAHRIELLIRDGKTVEEIIALQPTVNYDAEWAWQFMPPERFTQLIYDSLIANPRPEDEAG